MNRDLICQHDLPELEDPYEVAQWAGHQVQEHNRVFTTDELDHMVFSYGKQDAPAILVALRFEDAMDKDQCAQLVCDVWRSAEAPLEMGSAEEWNLTFTWVGFVRDGVRARRPRKVKTLYRGATYEHREGWSWTDNREQAEWFAERWIDVGGPIGKVWTIEIEPKHLLAHITTRGEDEWVILPYNGMVVTEAPPLPDSPT